MSTIVMRVDLDCDRCYKKIRKVLCKLQDRANIRTISYDEKSKTVTVSGPFDAEEVSDRLCSDAGKVITDIHVARGNQIMPGAKAAPKQPGKEGHGHGHGHGGGGKPEKVKHVKFDMEDERIDQHGYGHGGGGGGGKPEKMRPAKFDMFDEGVDKHAHHGHGHGGGAGGKPEKMRHAKFDMYDEGVDQHGHGPHGHGQATKPRVVTTTAMSRLEAPRTEPPVSMTAMAPMRMPTPGMTMMPQAMAAPSIWPAAPEWGYSAPAYAGGGAAAGGYYGRPVYDHVGYGPPYGGYGRNPYQPQYYEEEPSPGCSVM